MAVITVRPAKPADASAWLQMRQGLWPGVAEEEHRQEVKRFFAGQSRRKPWEVLLAEAEDARIAGFAEVSLRPYAEGCLSTPVAYLEGWYVVPELRRRGVGRALMAAAESWGRSQGCTEMASDTPVDNQVSAAAHRALGFAEVETLRCFRKDL
ncbi:MAG: GNAT family N-acetyltransferase [SAR202 cluster bacterium]|nr:GNAT family N-acetyltransferase [SAR202 cluster bacterium]